MQLLLIRGQASLGQIGEGWFTLTLLAAISRPDTVGVPVSRRIGTEIFLFLPYFI